MVLSEHIQSDLKSARNPYLQLSAHHYPTLWPLLESSSISQILSHTSLVFHWTERSSLWDLLAWPLLRSIYELCRHTYVPLVARFSSSYQGLSCFRHQPQFLSRRGALRPVLSVICSLSKTIATARLTGDTCLWRVSLTFPSNWRFSERLGTSPPSGRATSWPSARTAPQTSPSISLLNY